MTILKVLILAVQFQYGFTECPDCGPGTETVDVVIFEDRAIDAQINSVWGAWNDAHPKLYLFSRKIMSAREEVLYQ